MSKKIDEEALVKENMPKVRQTARSYAKITGIDQEELEGYGYEGLAKALKTYDPTRDPDFSNYASQYIRWEILRGISRELTNKTTNFYYDYVNAKEAIENKHDVALADKPELIEEVVEFLISTGKISGTSGSIKEAKTLVTYLVLGHISLNDVEAVAGLTNSGNLVNPVDYAIIAENPIVLKTIMNSLTPRETDILAYRWGFYDEVAHTYEEIAKKYNVTPQRIRKIEAQALKKLKNPHILRQIKELLPDLDPRKYGR